ncbi:polyprenyl synthetase family protein [Enterococcus cecorum]
MLGDALLTLCFEILAQLNLPASIKTQLIAHLAKATGPSGIVAGQASDVQAEKQDVPLERLVQIHERKTGAPLQYCFVAAGIVASGTNEQLTLLQTLGMDVGIAFQVRDDLLDILATTQELGKTVGRDLELEKSTYPRY